jgi:uncharacterized protein
MPRRTAPAQDANFDAFRLAHSQGTLAGEVDLRELPRVAELLAMPDATTSDVPAPFAWRITGGEDGKLRPSLAIRLDGVVPLVCQRCLGMLAWPVAQQTEVLLARSDAELAELDAVSEFEVVLAAKPLDALALVEDELLLTVPYAPLHDEGCDPPAEQ